MPKLWLIDLDDTLFEASVRQTSKMERFFSQTGTGVSGSSPWLHSREGSGLSTRGWLKSAEPVGRS